MLKQLLLFTFCVTTFVKISAQSDSLRIKKLFDKAYALEIPKPDSALFLYDEIIELSKQDFLIFAAKANNYKGIVYNDIGKYDSAITHYNKSIQLFNKITDQKGIASNYINIGNSLKLRGDFQDAITYYFKGISLYENLKNNYRLAISYANLASLYEDIAKYSDAQFNYHRSNMFAQKEFDSIQLVYNHYNLSNLFANTKKTDSAAYHIKKARIYLHNFKNLEINHLVNYGEGRIYFDQKKYQKALTSANKALKLAEQLQNPYYLALSYHFLGNIYLKKNDLRLADKYAKSAFQISRKYDNQPNLVKIYKQLVDINTKKGDFRKAYEFQSLYIKTKDSLLNKENILSLNLLQKQFETEKKNKEIAEQQLALKQQENKIQRKETQNNYMIGVSLFLLVASVLIWFTYRQRQKRKNQEIITLKRDFQIKTLESLIEGEEKERFRIAQELHDGVNGDLSAIKYKLSSLLEMNNQVIKEAVTMLDDSCKQIRAISHNLVPPSLENFSLIEATETYCHTINTANPVAIHFQTVGAPIDLPKKVAINIFRVIQELVTNSLKHANASEVNVQISYQNDSLQITVEDNGKGFNKERVSSQGIGLSNIASRLQYLNASEDFISNDKGTSYSFEIDTKKLNDH